MIYDYKMECYELEYKMMCMLFILNLLHLNR